MVLVAPAPSSAPAPAHLEVLALLREGAGRRPRVDPGLAGGLRAWLEDAAWLLVDRRGEDAEPLYLGPRQLLTGSVVSAPDESSDPFPAGLVLSSLVRALFRQIVSTGSVDDPLGDALGALEVDPGRRELVAHIRSMPAHERADLAAAVAAHAERLLDLTPRLAPGWLPRTGDRVAIPLAGGRVVLGGTFDLLIGAPEAGTATLCALGLSTGGRWAEARTRLHYLALLETLRSGTPPFRVALLHSAAGRYGVEDLLEEHLRAIVSHLAVQLPALGDTVA
jgi:hypothetical protein